MNKNKNINIISVGVLLSASIMCSDISSPYINLYSDNLSSKVRVSNNNSDITQLSQVEKCEPILDVTSIGNNINFCSESIQSEEELDDVSILRSVAARIQKSKSIPAEFAQIINEDFWDLI